jgi:hypothetical protein
VIGFTQPVLVSNPLDPFNPPDQIDDQHVFEVLIRNPRDPGLRLSCWCSIRGRILPVDFTTDNPPGNTHIDRATVVTTPPQASGAAFLVPQDFRGLLTEANEIWIRLHGDFVIDQKGRALDAEFARAQLLSGDRPATSEFGVQGGLFESWFWLSDVPRPQFSNRVSLNRAPVEELATLPGITDRLARSIVERRGSARFEKVEELTEIRGISQKTLDGLRDLVSLD